MTDYRIGYRAEARHWLAIAAEDEKATPGALTPDLSKRLTEALSELNEQVYGQGIASLSNTPAPTPAGSAEEESDDQGPEAPDAGASAAP
jgi:hypothetical protein